jgi:hypothetical protein
MAWYDILDPADILGNKQDERVNRANEALAQAQAKAEQASNANRGLYNQYNQRVESTYGDLAGKLNDYLKSFEDQGTYDPGQFSFEKDLNDYYSKFANQRQQQAMNALRESSDIFSSDYQDAMAAKQQALASEEWDKAYNKYMQDRSQAANEFNMNAQLGQTAYQNQLNKNQALLGQAAGAQDNLMNAYGNYVNNLANSNLANAQNYSNMVQAQTANNNSKKSLLGRVFG